MQDVEAFEKEVKEIGLQFVSSEEVERPHLMMEVDIDTEVDYSKLVEHDMVMKRMTKRNEPVYVKLARYEEKTLTLQVLQPCPEGVVKMYDSWEDKPVGTTFMDFCWYHSEGSNDSTLDEIETKFREDNAQPGNLTWYLPVHACDNLVEVLHVLNQSFLEGILEDSIIYGVKGIE